MKIRNLPITSEIRHHFHSSHNHIINTVSAFQMVRINIGFEYIQKVATVTRIVKIQAYVKMQFEGLINLLKHVAKIICKQIRNARKAMATYGMNQNQAFYTEN